MKTVYKKYSELQSVSSVELWNERQLLAEYQSMDYYSKGKMQDQFTLYLLIWTSSR